MGFSTLETAFIVWVLFLLVVILGIWFYDWVKTWRWLRVRKIRQLRRDYKDMRTYRIWRSEGLFGSFDEKRCPLYVTKAYNAEQALQRYFKHYRRVYKESHEYEGKRLQLTTRKWGTYLVMDDVIGYHRYYY